MRIAVVALAVCGGLVLTQPPVVDPAGAIELLRRGEHAGVWPLLRQGEDNTTRSLLIRDIPRSGISPDVVVRRLQVETDTSARRALLLVVGGYGREAIAPGPRDALVALLRQWLEADPDAGIHGAVEWLRRARGYGSAQTATSASLSRQRGWYVTAEGQTMTVVPGPVRVRMGSPDDEPGRQPASDSPDEPVHLVGIPRSFAIAGAEVTIAEFRRFLDANPDVKRGFAYPGAPARMAEVLARFSPDDDGPAIAVTWYEAAMYCNWLSAREGLPPSERVYPAGVLADGMRLPVDYLRRSGYRLPTEAEWEFAARTNTTTARAFGSPDDLLPQYAWFARNPPKTKHDPVDPNDPQRTARVGLLMPNDFGLFDLYGNVWEWTQDRVARHQAGQIDDDREDSVLEVLDRDARTRRGGAFPYGAAMARSAARGTVNSLPTNRRDNVGFRIARTIPPPD